MSFIRMDAGTDEDWVRLERATDEWQAGLAQRIKAMLLQLKQQDDEMAIDQLEHSLQTATRALRGGASEEWVVAALCHDIGTGISRDNHAAIAAEIMKPYVSGEVYEVVRSHQEFQRAHYHENHGKSLGARRLYQKETWYRSAVRFSDDWDQLSFDPAYETLSLDDFLPMVERVFAPERRYAQAAAGGARGGSRFRRLLIKAKKTISRSKRGESPL